jgi:hypothetical protein
LLTGVRLGLHATVPRLPVGTAIAPFPLMGRGLASSLSRRIKADFETAWQAPLQGRLERRPPLETKSPRHGEAVDSDGGAGTSRHPRFRVSIGVHLCASVAKERPLSRTAHRLPGRSNVTRRRYKANGGLRGGKQGRGEGDRSPKAKDPLRGLVQ